MADITPAKSNAHYDMSEPMLTAFRAPGGMGYFAKLMVWTTGLFFVLNIFALPAMLAGYAEFLAGMAEFIDDPNDWSAYMSAMGAYFAPASIWFLFFIVIIAISRAAFHRAYFYGDDGGTIPFRLGVDEVRQGASYLGWILLFMLFNTVAYLLVGVIIGIIGLIIGFAGGGEAVVLAIVALLSIILIFGATAATLWFGIRTAPSGALTALTREVHILSARKVSQYRFWPLFTAYMVTGVLGYIVTYFSLALAIMISLPDIGLGDIGVMVSGLDPEVSYEAMSTALDNDVSRIRAAIGILIASIGYAFFTLILTGPPAFFTRQWAQAHTPEQGA